MINQLSMVMNRFIIILLFIFSVSTQGIAGSIFADSFESGDISHSENGFWWQVGKNTNVTTAIAHTGKYSLRFKYPAVARGSDSWAEQRFDLGNTYPEVWIQFYIYFPNGTEGIGPKYVQRTDTGPNNDKFIRLWGNIPRTV